jgi:hypothetical protein
MVSIILVIFFGAGPRHTGAKAPGDEGRRSLPDGWSAPGKDVAGKVQALAGHEQPVPQGGYHGGVVGAEGRGRQVSIGCVLRTIKIIRQS